jgi:glycosyltransferase involved in cell wall biosynthesis
MHILWLRPNKPENISVGRHRIADHLRERGHRVKIMNTTTDDLLRSLAGDYDVVVGTTRMGAGIGAWRKLVRRTPLVIDHIDPIAQFKRNHSAAATWIVSQIEKATFRMADHVMVVYEEELPRVKRHASDVTKTHLGVDYETFANPNPEIIEDAKSVLRERTDTSRNQVIYIGGLEPAYHVPAILDAIELLPGWEFIILGDGSQRALIEQSEQENVRYLGTVEHHLIPGFLHNVDVGICLLDDRNTLKILEYGAAGLPTVNVRGDAESRFSGLIEFCSLEPESIADSIQTAYEEGQIDEFEEFTKQFSWKSVSDQYEAVLENVSGIGSPTENRA